MVQQVIEQRRAYDSRNRLVREDGSLNKDHYNLDGMIADNEHLARHDMELQEKGDHQGRSRLRADLQSRIEKHYAAEGKAPKVREGYMSRISQYLDNGMTVAGLGTLAGLALTGAWAPVAIGAMVKLGTAGLRYVLHDRDKSRLGIAAGGALLPGAGYVAEMGYSAYKTAKSGWGKLFGLAKKAREKQAKNSIKYASKDQVKYLREKGAFEQSLGSEGAAQSDAAEQNLSQYDSGSPAPNAGGQYRQNNSYRG